MPLQNPSPAQGMPAHALPELPPGPSLESLRGPITEPALQAWQILAIAVIGLLIVGFLLWQLIAYFRYRRNLVKALAPAEHASLQLEQAKGMQDDRDFATAHSEAFRAYLDAVLKTGVQGKTTAELASELTTGLPINGHDVSEFLNGCDQVKFARAALSPDDRLRLNDTAVKLIEAVELSRGDALKTEATSS
ncbi:MAG: hypothetical protein ACPGKS_04160 [Coraliomargarita sp.]